MFDREKPDLVIAFKNDLEAEVKRYQDGEKGLGTADMVVYARSQGCPVNVVEDPKWQSVS
jgi:hypothetical protein